MGELARMMPWALVFMLVLYITASWSTHSDTMTGESPNVSYEILDQFCAFPFLPLSLAPSPPCPTVASLPRSLRMVC